MTNEPIVRPNGNGIAARLRQFLMSHIGVVFAILRRVWPIASVAGYVLVTRYDDVREVFLADEDFPVTYKEKLDVIMGGAPFFLGMGDSPQYRQDTSAMRHAVRRDDIQALLLPATIARANALVQQSGGRLEVVDYVRTITFDVLCPYFGISLPAEGDLRVWATRLFDFQFADISNDPSLRADVDRMALALRAHIGSLVAARRAAGTGPDDVLGRCLAFQAEGRPGFTDVQIRSALIGLLVGGLPQPCMVIPQALEQLLRRHHALGAAQEAARHDDDFEVSAHLFEALRFDPLGPFVMRNCLRDHMLAAGTDHPTKIAAGSTVFASFASAMMDPRAVPNAGVFDATRPPEAYMHFGYALHQCFGLHINQALLPQMLKPLLKRPNLRRAHGAEGHLTKAGPFADKLWVVFDTSIT